MLLLSFVAVLLMSANALAVSVTLTANDGMGTTSFNAAGKWSDGLAPSAGNGYSTLGYLLRTPSVTGNYTFAGNSLTVGGGNGGGANPFLTTGGVNNNSLINKTPTGTGVIITVNNLILDAGYIRDGMGSADVWTVAGNISVTANGGGFGNQCRLNVDSAISGSGTLYCADNGSGEVARTTYINSGLNTYNGNIQLLGTTAERSRIFFSDNSLMNFIIGASGVNNSISGTGTATFEGDFNFNLTGASTNFGDNWKIVSATGIFNDATFTVNGFTSIGGGLWTRSANGATYRFNESVGTLTVIPEPATIALLALGGLCLRRRKA
jgi:hypothetical protein